MAKAVACLTTNPVITVSDIDGESCEPRVHDLKLAEALGFGRPHDIRTLIRRHMEVLATFGDVFSERKKPTTQGGRPGTDYWLNKRQALYITAKSDTERAALVTVQMVEVFDAVTGGEQIAPPAEAKSTALAKPSPRLVDLFSWACMTVAEWERHGIVGDSDEALRLVHRTILEVAGDDFLAAQPKRRRA